MKRGEFASSTTSAHNQTKNELAQPRNQNPAHSSMKSPAFQFYAADYLADERVQLMTIAAEGAYIRLLAYCWREGSIPADPAMLSALCKNADSSAIDQAKSAFVPHKKDSTRLVHPRLESERKKQEVFSKNRKDSGKKGANYRWKQPHSSAIAEPLAEPSHHDIAEPIAVDGSSSSSSSSTSVESKDARETSLPPILPTLDQAMAFAQSAGINPKAAEVWWRDCEGRGISPNGFFRDGKGQEIRHWQATMTSFGLRWQNNDEQRKIERAEKAAKPVRASL